MEKENAEALIIIERFVFKNFAIDIVPNVTIDVYNKNGRSFKSSEEMKAFNLLACKLADYFTVGFNIQEKSINLLSLKNPYFDKLFIGKCFLIKNNAFSEVQSKPLFEVIPSKTFFEKLAKYSESEGKITFELFSSGIFLGEKPV